MDENGYTSVFSDGVWWLLDQDGVTVTHGTTVAEAWDQLDDGPVPNDWDFTRTRLIDLNTGESWPVPPEGRIR